MVKTGGHRAQQGTEPNLQPAPATADREIELYAASKNVGVNRIHRVGEGETLSGIAKLYLGKASAYTQIIELNPVLAANPNLLRPGMLIELPAKPEAKIAAPVVNQPAPANAKPCAEPETQKYIVRPHDNLWSIARKLLGNGELFTQIRDANPGLQPEKLQAGMVINIPRSAEQSSHPASQEIYKIQSGDTLSDIAKKQLGDANRWREIAALNPEVDPQKLKLGASLILPKEKEKPAVATVVVKDGDTIFALAKRATGDARNWGLFLAANPSIDPAHLQTGATLNIPNKETRMSEAVSSRIGGFINRPLHPIEASENAPQHVKDFIAAYTKEAMDVERVNGIPAELILAQAALETGWGASPGANPLGMKAGKGDVATTQVTTEYENGQKITVSAKFASYSSVAEAFNAYSDKMSSMKSYQGIWPCISDYKACLQVIGDSPYATDPKYGEKLSGVAKYFTRSETSHRGDELQS